MPRSSKLIFGRRAFLAGLAAATVPAAVLAQPARPPVKVGVVLSMSGPGAAFGLPERTAIEVVTEQINREGGIQGAPLELVLYDDKTDASEAARGVTQIINRDRVVAIVGPGTGGNVLASAPIAERLKVPLLAPAGVVALTDRKNSFYPWVFRVASSDRDSLGAIFDELSRTGVKRLGVFHQEDAFGKGGLDFANEFSKQRNIEIVAVAAAPPNATDVGAQATRLREARPDAIFMQVSFPALGVNFVRTARQLGLGAPVFSGTGLGIKPFVDAVGNAADGVHVVTIGSMFYDPLPAEKKLADMLARRNAAPTGWAEPVGSNGILAIAAAARKVQGELTGEKMRAALEGLCGVETYMPGMLCFSPDNHDGVGVDSLVIARIQAGKLHTVRRFAAK